MPIGPTSGFLDFTNATPRADVIIALSNIGVGTDAPLHALDIRGTANVADIIINNDLTLIGGLTTNTLTINSVSMSTTSNFQQVTNVGNATTTNTVQFTNPTTGFAVSSNASVGGELSVSGNAVVSSNLTVSGNAEVGTANLFVDTVSGNVGIGMTDPGHNLDIVSEMNLRSVSNTASIKYNSNVVTEFVRSKKFIKYPRVAMTSDSSGGYVVSGSSVRNSSYPFHSAFDETNSVSVWQAQINTFTNGVANTGTFEGITCQYISIDLGDAILLQYAVLYSRTTTNTYAPVKGKIYGSNDETNYTLVATYDNLSMGANENVRIFATTNQYFRYFTFTVEEALDSGADNTTVIRDLEYYGIPEYDPEAHGTDVIMRSVPNVPNTDWLEVYWDGQDYTSMPATVTDKSGNGVTGTPNGGVGFDTEYKAFTFDGVNDYISGTLPSSASGAWVHSVAAWVKFTDFDSIQEVSWIGSADAANTRQSFTFQVGGETGTMGINGSNVQFRFTSPLTTGKWHHVVYGYNGGQSGSTSTAYQVFIDGVEASRFSGVGSGTLNLPTGPNFFVGSGLNGGSPFNGSISNFRLFNRAPTADEVWQLYAYQKEYFDVSPDVVTFKGGRLGIGTSEPRAPLDIMGIPYGRGSKPCFSARRNAGDVSGGLIIFNHVEVNQQNGYDSGNGVFTAPISGLYLFSFYGMSNDITLNTFGVLAYKNGVAYEKFWPYTHHSGASPHKHVSGTQIVPMAKGDTLSFYVTTGVMYAGGNSHNSFVGYLIE